MKVTIQIDELHEFLKHEGLVIVGRLVWPACERHPVVHCDRAGSQQASVTQSVCDRAVETQKA
jgi:hypothetical protein